jgi:hypothetical protein
MLPNNQVGWVQTRNVTPASETMEWGRDPDKEANLTQSGWFQERILALLERAATFRETYQDNPYVTVRGFEISLSLTGPTLGMSFEFKDQSVTE